MQDDNAPRDAALPLRLAVVAFAVTQVGATQLTNRAQRGLTYRSRSRGATHACKCSAGRPATLGGRRRRTLLTEATSRSAVAVSRCELCHVRALALASPAIVQCVFGAAPAVVCVLSRLWLREAFTRRRGLAVSAALCGVALVAAPSSSGSHHLTIGVVIALCAVLCAATYKVRWKSRFLAPSPDFVLRAWELVDAVAICSLPIAAALAATGTETPPGRWTARFVDRPRRWRDRRLVQLLHRAWTVRGSPVLSRQEQLAIPGNAVRFSVSMRAVAAMAFRDSSSRRRRRRSLARVVDAILDRERQPRYGARRGRGYSRVRGARRAAGVGA